MLDDPSLRRLLRAAIAASLAINILALTTPIYLTQIYNRVLSARSVSTLVAITAITLVVILLQSVLDLVRTLLCARASAGIYAKLEARVLAACRRGALSGGAGRRARPLEDLELVRAFATGPLPAALLDMVFVPLFVIVLFLVHVLIGVLALVVATAVTLLTFANRAAMTRVTEQATEGFRSAGDLAEAMLRNIEPALAMGFAGRAEARITRVNRDAILGQMRAVAATGGLSSTVKGVRSASQILVIALAAWLALGGAITMGAIVAASILFSKTLAPLDQVLGAWRALFQARGAWERLSTLTAADPAPRMRLPAPRGALAAQDLSIHAPAGDRMILENVSFALAAGAALGVVGPSGSGKSTLARALVGAWPASRGTIRLDGADMTQLDMDAVGRHIGYLPQTLELLPGTLAENIRRFGPDDPDGVVHAATAAGAHEMILAQPRGYDTIVGGPGFALSGGQRQRIGIARALYGDPMLLVLDEPDAGLDRDGEAALSAAIAAARGRGATVVLIAHRGTLVAGLDHILVLAGGRVRRFGPASEVLPQLVSPARSRA